MPNEVSERSRLFGGEFGSADLPLRRRPGADPLDACGQAPRSLVFKPCVPDRNALRRLIRKLNLLASRSIGKVCDTCRDVKDPGAGWKTFAGRQNYSIDRAVIRELAWSVFDDASFGSLSKSKPYKRKNSKEC